MLFCIAVTGGCWGRKFFRAPSETIETSAKIDSLLKENLVLQRRIYSIEKAITAQQDYSRSVNAQLRIDLEELKDQMNALIEAESGSGSPGLGTGRTERSQRRVPTGQETADPRDSLPVPGDTAGADTSAGAAQAVIPSPDDVYRQIYLDFSRMEYQIALDESESFLDDYPDHPLVEEVRFIRGECYMEQRKFFDALKEFSAILQEFPGGEKVPSALLRMAVSYEGINDRDLAAGIVRRLIREYPGSEEAAAARERFRDLIEE